MCKKEKKMLLITQCSTTQAFAELFFSELMK